MQKPFIKAMLHGFFLRELKSVKRKGNLTNEVVVKVK